MLESLRPLMAAKGRIYRKCRNILAKRASGGEKIGTVTADGLETVNTAVAGDFIIQNTTGAEEQYILGAGKFSNRYELVGPAPQAGWMEYSPLGKIKAVELTPELLGILKWPEEIEFMARWGEIMTGKKGDFLAMPLEGNPEIYRIARVEFFETYTET